jgi:hypothetical protein
VEQVCAELQYAAVNAELSTTSLLTIFTLERLVNRVDASQEYRQRENTVMQEKEKRQQNTDHG